MSGVRYSIVESVKDAVHFGNLENPTRESEAKS